MVVEDLTFGGWAHGAMYRSGIMEHDNNVLLYYLINQCHPNKFNF